MKNIKKKLNRANLIMFVMLFIVMSGIVIYRLVHPTPPLEHRACMDRLNSLAMYQTKYFEKNGMFTSKIHELSRDNSVHFFHSCPLTGEKFTIEVTDSTYTIKCREHNHYIKNNILYKN